MTTPPGHPLDCDIVIFDCDGVLLDSEILLARAHTKGFVRAGLALSEAEVLQRFLGIADAEMYRLVEAESGHKLPTDHDAWVRAEIARAYAEDLQAIPDVCQALDALRVPVCVASSSTSEKLHLGLARVHLYERFAPHIFSATMVARGKPAPDLFQFAAAQMKAEPGRCLVIEDSVAGVLAGVAAGMPVIGFYGGSHCDAGHGARLLQAGAISAVQSMLEMATILENLASGRR